MIDIDYTKYSYKELLEALDSIDRHQYPDNYKKLIAELEKPERKDPEAIAQEEKQARDRARYDKNILLIFLSPLWFLWTIFVYQKGEVYVGIRRSGGSGYAVTMENDPVLFKAVLVLSVAIGIYSFAKSVRRLTDDSQS